MASATYAALDKAWKSTCRVLFGEEVGELAPFAGWLKEYVYATRPEKSMLSGKPIAITMDDYSQKASFISLDEVDFGKKASPLPLNDLKDIDSLVRAASERISYTGNVVLGNSSYVEGSTGVLDSHYVLDSAMVNKSKYIAYSRWETDVEYCFGGIGTTLGQFMVKDSGSNLTRCFECHMANDLSDCYFCAKTINCKECIFCFGAENQSHCIGNTKLPRDKYAELKKKLLAEMAQALRRDKRIFSLLKIVEMSSKYAPNELGISFKQEKKRPFTLKPIADAFAATSSLLLGRKLSMPEYSDFLQKHVPNNPILKSCLTGSYVTVGGYRANLLGMYGLKGRMATEDEVREIGRHGIGEANAARLSIDAGTLTELLHPIAYFNLEKDTGKISNVARSAVVINATDGYESSALIQSKKCAYCFWTNNDEAVFGSYMTHNSSFCINTYISQRLARAFECDSCENCSDAYFLHNCENVRDSMFCFNVKNLAHAIGNAELPPAQYRGIKSSLVQQMSDELEKKKDLKWDIFTIGCRV
ncbi:MAG: hypothetical protein NTX79_06905 [Candidatus Micrarchaeota archaeon]|nr:hypothetical protein [Candidatus Micrarchaeota archaeon]